MQGCRICGGPFWGTVPERVWDVPLLYFFGAINKQELQIYGLFSRTPDRVFLITSNSI